MIFLENIENRLKDGYLNPDLVHKGDLMIPAYLNVNRNKMELFIGNLEIHYCGVFTAVNLKVIHGWIILHRNTVLNCPNLEEINGEIILDNSNKFYCPKLFQKFNERYFRNN